MSSTGSEVTVRPVKRPDLPQIHKILDHYVTKTVTTFWLETPSLAMLEEEYDGCAAKNYPYLVAVKKSTSASDSQPVETGQERVIGYINAHGYNKRPGYDRTAEMTILLDPNERYSGAGSKLLNALIHHLQNPGKVQFCIEVPAGVDKLSAKRDQCDVRQLLAIMAVDTQGRDGGLGLRDWYKRFGFVESAYLKDVGWKMDRWIDVIFMQLKIEQAGTSPSHE